MRLNDVNNTNAVIVHARRTTAHLWVLGDMGVDRLHGSDHLVPFFSPTHNRVMLGCSSFAPNARRNGSVPSPSALRSALRLARRVGGSPPAPRDGRSDR